MGAADVGTNMIPTSAAMREAQHMSIYLENEIEAQP